MSKERYEELTKWGVMLKTYTPTQIKERIKLIEDELVEGKEMFCAEDVAFLSYVLFHLKKDYMELSYMYKANDLLKIFKNG